MKRRVENWTVERLHKARARISFPEYQRQPNLWSIEKKGLLIDSILQDIDIPKLYFNEAEDRSLEVVDGQQRLWAIWGFIDDEYSYTPDGKRQKFSELSPDQRDAIVSYSLQVSIIKNATDEYLRELFLRLQLGLLLVMGEKLNAATGNMKDFVFKRLAKQKFIRGVRIVSRRFAKETLCAQIAINSFTRAKLGSFSRTRYEDLLSFFKEYEHPQGRDLELLRKQTKRILELVDDLWECFGTRTGELNNRSYILSVYLFFEEIHMTIGTNDRARFAQFSFALWKRLKEEISKGIDRSNRELYSFEALLSSAPGEKYQIERRHQKLIEYYEHYKKTAKIKGD